MFAQYIHIYEKLFIKGALDCNRIPFATFKRSRKYWFITVQNWRNPTKGESLSILTSLSYLSAIKKEKYFVVGETFTESCTAHNNVIMSEEICIIFITILTCSLAFDLSCPGSGQWNFRASFYCSEVNKYTCLLDATKTRYTETCDGFREETDGVKSTINRNNFDATKCRPERFQPIGFTTVGNSDCVFKKSKCVQEGQIVAHEIKEESSLVDTKCLCDYTKGYSFINLPKDKCYCSPSVDDCSCFREFCSSGKKLSPDYQCTTEIDMKNRTWNCSNIAFADDGQNGDQIRRYINDIDPKNGRRSRIAVQVIVPILVITVVGLLIWCWKTSKLDKIKERIVRLVYEKDDNNESEAIILLTEIPLSSDKNDEIPLESTLSRLGSDIITSVHDNCSSTEDIKLLQTDDRATDLSSQINQNDSSLPKDKDSSSDDGSFKSAEGSTIGLNEIEDNKTVINNSTGTTKKSEMSKLVFQNGENKSDIHSGSKEDTNDNKSESEAIILPTEISHSSKKNDEIQIESSTKDIGNKTEASDEESCMVEVEDNKIKKNEELNTFAKEQKDKSDEPVEDICSVVAENEKTSVKQHKGKSEESGEEICTVEAKINTIKENEELYTYEKANTDKSNETVEEIGTVDAENEKTFEIELVDQSAESNEEICIDEAKNIKIKENEELSMSKSKFETDDADKNVDTETPDVQVNITAESFDSLLEGFEESEPTEHESADSDTDKRTAAKNPKSDD
ncbi:unnamed protein product [Mytilus coruscus]|uniref:Uncharacterized protein n=1 Tax=Mytilus coruscus TaxID=42192 RepID=A0A6J8DTA5_MYTCO|nr:unnamed protein product [Mytilus coruscus]